jgi:hypothetical protein
MTSLVVDLHFRNAGTPSVAEASPPHSAPARHNQRLTSELSFGLKVKSFCKINDMFPVDPVSVYLNRVTVDYTDKSEGWFLLTNLRLLFAKLTAFSPLGDLFLFRHQRKALIILETWTVYMSSCLLLCTQRLPSYMQHMTLVLSDTGSNKFAWYLVDTLTK